MEKVRKKSVHFDLLKPIGDCGLAWDEFTLW